MIKKLFIAATALFWMSCANHQEASTHDQAQSATTEKDKFKDVKFDNEKDFICEMPVSAGVNDTAHYNGKVYGFCSTECKTEFQKDPGKYVAVK